MATTLQFRRGNSAAAAGVTGANGEIYINTQTKTIHVHDGVTAGGSALANVSIVDTAYSNAASYADTKAATAYSNATSYADTRAATAYSNAMTYAATMAASAYSNAYYWANSFAATAYSNATAVSANASNITSGTVAVERLGAGVANSTTILYGNGVWGPAPSGGGGGSVDLTNISSDVTPSVSGVYNIGTTAAKWYGLNVSNSITINGSRLSGTSNTLSTTSDFVAGALLADNLLISDNLITPDSTTARQYLGDKGIVVINGNLDVQGDWMKAPVAQTVSVSTSAMVNTTFTTSDANWSLSPGASYFSVGGSISRAANTYVGSLRAGDTIVAFVKDGTSVTSTYTVTATPNIGAGQWTIYVTGGNMAYNGYLSSITFRKAGTITTSTLPLTTGTAGAVRFNRDLLKFQGHNGTSWGDLAAAAAAEFTSEAPSSDTTATTLYNISSGYGSNTGRIVASDSIILGGSLTDAQGNNSGAVVLGGSVVASTNTVAIGRSSYVSGSTGSIAIGPGAQITGANGAVAIGPNMRAYTPGSYVYNSSRNGLSPTIEITTDMAVAISGSSQTYYTSFLDGSNASTAYTNNSAVNLNNTLAFGSVQNYMAMVTVRFLIHTVGTANDWKIVEVKAALVQNGSTSTWSYTAISTTTLATGGGSNIAQITPSIEVTSGAWLNQKVAVGTISGNPIIHVTGKYRIETLWFT